MFLLVCRATVEGERVVGVLRALLMEHIVLAIIPVRERCMVRACLLNGFIRAYNLLIFRGNGFTLFATESLLMSRLKVHSMRVDDLGFFLHVEGLLVVLDLSSRKLVVEVLTIVREQRLRVGVTHEAIDAARLTCTLVSRRHSLEWRILPDATNIMLCIHAILSMVLAIASWLTVPRRCVHVFFITALSHAHLSRLVGLRGHLVVLLPGLALGGLRTLSANSRLVHRLERIVTRHARIVQIVLLLRGFATRLRLAHTATVLTSLSHISLLSIYFF